jgi:ribonuclease T2
VPWAFSANHLSLHGLWPGFTMPRSGGETFPENCSTKAKLVQEAMPRDYIDLAPSYTTWNATKHQAEVGGLAKHEWLKHGTCSGLSPDGYFAEALRAFSLLPGDRGTPELIKANVGGSVSAAALRSSYAKRVAIKAIDAQVDCPDHVMRGRDSPNCSTIRINQLGQCMLDAKKKR